MAFEKVETEFFGDVGVIRLNEPETRNAMSYRMLDDIQAALDDCVVRCRALILTAVGPGFCSGAGLGDLDKVEGVPDHGASLETHTNPLMTRLRDLPMPWIAAVRGGAAGFGCSLALAGDMVIASDTAFFMQAFVRVGLVPDGGASYALPRDLTRVQAMEMILLGERLLAAKALEWGLVNQVVPDDRLEVVSLDLAQRLATGPTIAMKLARRAVWSALDLNWEAALKAEREGQRAAGQTSDFSEGLAAFREKRKPQFKGS